MGDKRAEGGSDRGRLRLRVGGSGGRLREWEKMGPDRGEPSGCAPAMAHLLNKTALFGLIAGETAGDPGVPPGTALAWLAIALELDAKARLRVAILLEGLLGLLGRGGRGRRALRRRREERKTEGGREKEHV